MIISDWFSPGYKAGGPIRSVVNLALAFQDTFSIYVLTSDRDLGSKNPYPNIKTNEWLTFSKKIKVCYLSKDQQNHKSILYWINDSGSQYIYLNSMFSTIFTIYPLYWKWREKISQKIVLAPRGMLRNSALKFKPLKKKIFLKLLNSLKIINSIQFHATDITEETDIQNEFGNSTSIRLIPNIPSYVTEWEKRDFNLPLRLLFVGRVHPIKGLDHLLHALFKVTSEVHLSILGSLEEKEYWEKCSNLIKIMPKNITVTYLGEFPPDEVYKKFKENHAFILPTHGENFGHAIFEALAAGLPIIISDQTPWKNLESKKIGWDLSLSDTILFTTIIDKVACMNQETYDQWSYAAWNFAKKYSRDTKIITAYQQLFT